MRSKIHQRLAQIINAQSRLSAINFDLDEFMDFVVNEMQSLTPATGVVVELADNDVMVYRAASGSVKDSVGLRLPITNSISGLCVNKKEILISLDTETDSRVNLEACRKVKARSLVVTPLFHEGKVVGVLKILSDEINKFNKTDIQTLQLMAGLIGFGIAHQVYVKTNNLLLEKIKNNQQRLEYLSEHDILTNLANRNLFNKHFNDLMNSSNHNKNLHALMVLDVDHFKEVNDNQGHAIGDALLKAFTLRLTQAVRPNDVIARFGGDEFMILLSKLDNKHVAEMIATRIVEKMRLTFRLEKVNLNITTSIGLTFFHSNDKNLSLDQLFKQADEALYAAKNANRDTFRIFEN